MNNGQLFCDVAHDAFSNEEIDLAKLTEPGSDDALSVGCIGELPQVYLIRKEALRRQIPHVGEVRYSDRKRTVDLCFLDQADRTVASFELKHISENPREREAYWRDALEDVSKHLDEKNKIEKACEGHERYNVLLFVTEKDESKVEVERIVGKEIGNRVRAPVFFTSDSIKLNPVKGTNPCAPLWNYMRVVVFSGQFVPAS